jgi:hypothetical protein
MKIKDIAEKQAAMRDKAVLDEVNTIYMANRDEFETTTKCENGLVWQIDHSKGIWFAWDGNGWVRKVDGEEKEIDPRFPRSIYGLRAMQERQRLRRDGILNPIIRRKKREQA